MSYRSVHRTKVWRYLDPRTAVGLYLDQITVKNPIKTKMITSFVIGSLADYACQLIEHRLENNTVPEPPEPKTNRKF